MNQHPVGRGRVKVTPQLWEHTLETAGVAVGFTFALAAVSASAGWPAWPLIAVYAAVAVAVLITSHTITGARGLSGYVLLWGGLLTGWFGFARLTSPWSVQSFVLLFGPAIVLTPAGALIVARHTVAAAEAEHLAAKKLEASETVGWTALLARFGVEDVRAVAVTVTRSGRMVHYRLPDSGRWTIGHLEQLADRIEVAKRLPKGAIRFEEGKHSADVIMHVTERDALTEDVPFPSDLSPATVNRPLGLGTAEDGSPGAILLREVATLIAGVRGTGKSNLLNVLTAQLGRCVDVVIFAIDTKNRYAAQWILPWLRGEAPRPVIDWVATTKPEAGRMLNALQAAIESRSSSLAGTEKIVPSSALPAIVLIVDEVAIIFGVEGGVKVVGNPGDPTNRELQRAASRITQVGRSEAIDPVFATLRATVSMMGGGDLKSQCDIRIGLGVNSRADAASIVPDDRRAAAVMARINTPGVALLSVKGNTSPSVIKVYRLDPARIAAIAVQCGWIRPEPDGRTAKAMGADYAERWERFQPIAAQWLAGGDDQPAPAQPAAAAPAGRRTAAPVIDTDAEFERIVERLGPDPEAQLNPARKRMREILAERGPAGATPLVLRSALEREQLMVARETIQRWLRADANAGLVRDTGTGLWIWNTGR